MPLRGADGIDVTRPNMARVYDYLLGGSQNFPADREQAARLTDPRDGFPGLPAILRDNREFLVQAVTWLASGAGVRAVSARDGAGRGSLIAHRLRRP
jgi:hypothetical protein